MWADVLMTEVVETCPAAGQPHTTMFLHRLGEAWWQCWSACTVCHTELSAVDEHTLPLWRLSGWQSLLHWGDDGCIFLLMCFVFMFSVCRELKKFTPHLTVFRNLCQIAENFWAKFYTPIICWMHVLYNFSLVGMVILDLQICLSRFCIAARVMALQREISGELWVDEWTREPR